MCTGSVYFPSPAELFTLLFGPNQQLPVVTICAMQIRERKQTAQSKQIAESEEKIESKQTVVSKQTAESCTIKGGCDLPSPSVHLHYSPEQHTKGRQPYPSSTNFTMRRLDGNQARQDVSLRGPSHGVPLQGPTPTSRVPLQVQNQGASLTGPQSTSSVPAPPSKTLCSMTRAAATGTSAPVRSTKSPGAPPALGARPKGPPLYRQGEKKNTAATRGTSVLPIGRPVRRQVTPPTAPTDKKQNMRPTPSRAGSLPRPGPPSHPQPPAPSTSAKRQAPTAKVPPSRTLHSMTWAAAASGTSAPESSARQAGAPPTLGARPKASRHDVLTGMRQANDELHPFIKCITINPISLCIIGHTWCLTALRSLHRIVTSEGNHGACDKEILHQKIDKQIERADDLASEIYFKHEEVHSYGHSYSTWPGEPCHYCGKDSGHDIDHYSTHLTSGSFEDPTFQKLCPESTSDCDTCAIWNDEKCDPNTSDWIDEQICISYEEMLANPNGETARRYHNGERERDIEIQEIENRKAEEEGRKPLLIHIRDYWPSP